MTAGSGLNDLTVSFAGLTQGTYSSYVDLTPKSINASSSTDMSDVRLNFSVTVMRCPNRSTLVLLGLGLIGLLCYVWQTTSGVVCLAFQQCTAPRLRWFLCAIASTRLLFLPAVESRRIAALFNIAKEEQRHARVAHPRSPLWAFGGK